MRNGIFRFLIENDSAAEKLKEKEEWRWEKEKKREIKTRERKFQSLNCKSLNRKYIDGL